MIFVTVAFGLFSVGVAFAQPKAVEGEAAARTLFKEGRQAMKEGKFVIACDRFEQSARILAGRGVLLNLADCQEKVGRFASAAETFRTLIGKLSESDERRQIADKRLAGLLPRIPTLTLSIASGAPDATTVTVDGKTLASDQLAKARPVDPGSYTVTVSAPGHADRSYQLEIKEAQKRAIDVSAGAPLGPPKQTVAPPPKRTMLSEGVPPAEEKVSTGGAMRTAAFVLGGVGIAGLAVGGITGGLALDKKALNEEHCSDALAVCDATGKAAAQSTVTFSYVSTAGFALGGAALGTGAILFIVDGVHGASEDTAVRPTFGPGYAGLTYATRW